MPGEAIYQGDVPFLLNVNHKGAQFVTPFFQVYNENVLQFLKDSSGGFQYIHVPPILVA